MKEIRIFNHVWHLAHQHALCKIPGTKWTWLIQHRRSFSAMPRGNMMEEHNINWVPHYESGKYDVVLLHLDQQCLEETLWEIGKGSCFNELNQVITDIPKIVIMHGTPYYPEMFPGDITEKNYKEKGYTKDQIGMSSKLIDRFKEVAKDCDKLIFNSKTAMRQWGMQDDSRAQAIWHGIDDEGWRDLPKEPRVVTMISPAGLDKYYDRTFLQAVKEELGERGIHHCHITVDARFGNFDEYQEFLGRSLIYFNPTKESCMPRSRAEAMLSGCCVITTFNQDSEEFFEDGINGYKAIRNPNYIADLVEGLLDNYDKAVAIGQKGKETAQKLFKAERFQNEWRDILESVTQKYETKKSSSKETPNMEEDKKET